MWEAEDLPKHVERARRLGYEEVRYNRDHDHDHDNGDCNYDGHDRD